MKYIDSCLLGCHQAPFISLIMILVLPPRQELPFDFPWNLCFPENISPLQPGVSYIVRDWVTGLDKACNLKLVTECRIPKLFLTPLGGGICMSAALGETGAGALENNNSLKVADKPVLIRPWLKPRFWCLWYCEALLFRSFLGLSKSSQSWKPAGSSFLQKGGSSGWGSHSPECLEQSWVLLIWLA